MDGLFVGVSSLFTTKS